MSFLKRWRRRAIQNMPYATSALVEVCTQCNHPVCLSHCPEGIITLTPDHLPTLEFSQSGCVFCEACVNACFEENGKHQGFEIQHQCTQVRMQIDPTLCLAWNQSICSLCKDTCPCEIKFVGMFYPEITSCNGCGLCISRCPTDAILF